MGEQVPNVNGNPQTIEYDHVSYLVQNQEKLNFLKRRTTLREIKERQGQETMDIVLPDRHAISKISFCSNEEEEDDEKRRRLLQLVK